MNSDGPFGDAAAALAGLEQNPAMVVVVAGQRLEIRAVSAAVRAWLPDREMLGVPVAEAFADLIDEQVVELYQACYRTGDRYQGNGWRLTRDVGTGGAAGEVTEVSCDFVMAPWRDADGTVVGVVGTVADVATHPHARVVADARATQARQDLREVRDLLTALQGALLPTGLPLVPGADIAATYLLAAQEAAGGGDWFDVVVRPAGRVALVVGDVVGHGIAASAVMGQLRAVLHQQLLAGTTVGEALRALDVFARTVPDAHAATVCVAELAPDTGHVEYSTAGHPPPLVVSTAGEAHYLAPTGSAPLATDAGRFGTGRVELGEGELVLLYSDGIVERPGRTLAQNTLDLARTTGRSYLGQILPAPTDRRTPDRVCEQTLELLIRSGGYADDITLLALHRVPAPPELVCTEAAEPAAVGTVRRRLAAWLEDLGARAVDSTAVQTAVGELVTNAVEHAYDGDRAPADGAVTVTATLLASGEAQVSIVDTGTWRAPAAQDHRGRGLAISRGLVGHLDLRHDAGGTAVTIRHRLSRPARLLTALDQSHQWPLPGEGTPFSVDVAPDGGFARVAGPLDLITARDLRIALFHATHGGRLTGAGRPQRRDPPGERRGPGAARAARGRSRPAARAARQPGAARPGARRPPLHRRATRVGGMRTRHGDWELPDSPESAAEARRLATELLTGLPLDSIEVVLLLTTELVTNAVQHGLGPIGLRLRAGDDGVRVEVRDRSDALPVVQQLDPDALSGRGLLLVEGLADGWGVLAQDIGKTVWFSLTGRPASQHADLPVRRTRDSSGADQ